MGGASCGQACRRKPGRERAVPPPPGSARATIRVPTGAEEIKARIGELQSAIQEIKILRKNLAQNFFDVGMVLKTILERKLYEARGFGTFEAFLDRELDLGKTTSMRLVHMVDLFHRDAALQYGLDRVMAAMLVLEAPREAGGGEHHADPVSSAPHAPADRQEVIQLA